LTIARLGYEPKRDSLINDNSADDLNTNSDNESECSTNELNAKSIQKARAISMNTKLNDNLKWVINRLKLDKTKLIKSNSTLTLNKIQKVAERSKHWLFQCWPKRARISTRTTLAYRNASASR
jgi:hypothetical protein